MTLPWWVSSAKNNKSAYREEVQCLTAWCKANSLSLNVDKTKEMVVDFEQQRMRTSLGHSTPPPSPRKPSTASTSCRGKPIYLPPILTMFYRGTIESVLSSCITAWLGNCTISDRKTLQRIVRTAEKITGVSLPSITYMYTHKANHPPTHTHPAPTAPFLNCCYHILHTNGHAAMHYIHVGEYGSHMGYMFFLGLGVNEDAINICHHKLIEHVMEYFIDQELEHSNLAMGLTVQ
ncbi:hypothetical protein QTP86_017168 [Hemibagrus guttatus]|nr:hypothetical protein QTP86_017168 [Hemibagrus guttatus]